MLRDFFQGSSSKRTECIKEPKQNNVYAPIGQRDRKFKTEGKQRAVCVEANLRLSGERLTKNGPLRLIPPLNIISMFIFR